MKRNHSWMRRPGPKGSGIVVAAVLVAGLALFSGIALALGGSSFDTLDGNTAEDGVELDWDSESIEGDIIVAGDEPSGSSDDSFGQGSKEDTEVPSVVDGSIPPNKSDLVEFGIYKEGTGSNAFLHLFWTRVQDPSGTTLMDFEINQNKCDSSDPTNSICSANGVTPVRTSGDLLLTYELTKGGKVPDLYLYEWLDGSEGATAADCKAANSLPCWGNEEDLDLAGAAEGSINDPDAIYSGLLGRWLDPRTFGEASVDLSFIFDPNVCQSFGSAYLKSRSSDSFTAALKDFIAPVPINLGNCGTIIVNKIVDPSTSTATFDFSVTGPTTDTFQLGHGGSHTNSGVLQGAYTIEETDANTGGYDLIDVGCTKNGEDLTVDSTPDFTLGIGDEVECTFTNQQRGKIIVEKETTGGYGEFGFTSLTLTSPFTLTTTSAGDAGKDSIMFSDLISATYDVAETAPTPAWDLTSSTCSDGSDPGAIGLSAGETVTCTFTNTKRGTIRIVKQTNPRNLADSFGFTDNIASPNSFSLIDNDVSKEFLNVLPTMTYTVTENDPTSSGFGLDTIVCADTVDPGSGGTNSTGNVLTRQATINLDPGETVTCTFTNSTGAVKVYKTAKNHGLGAGDWPLAGVTFQLKQGATVVLSDTTGTSGTVCFNRLVPGQSFDVLELSAPAGYSLDATNPRPVVVAAGKTCDGSGEAAPQPVTFINTPLSSIQVKFTSLAGLDVTAAKITCTVAPDPVDDTPNDYDDLDETITDLVPGTYNCEIVIDP